MFKLENWNLDSNDHNRSMLELSKTNIKANLSNCYKTYNLFQKWWNYITAAWVKSVSKYFEVPLQVYVLLCFKEQFPITACFHVKPKSIYRLSAKLEEVAADLEEWKEHLIFKWA